jgi:hypothetical protein
LRSKDGLVFHPAHNPKIVSSECDPRNRSLADIRSRRSRLRRERSIHSLAYFGPVIEEVRHNPVPDTYIEYLRRKMQPFAEKKVTGQESHPASVQKKTDSDDR